MSNDVFEDRIKRLLNQSVDTDLGPRRPAPPFIPEQRTSRRPVWLIPLAVAATVAIISGGSVGLAHLASGHRTTPAGNSNTPAPSPTRTPVHTLIHVPGGQIAVPDGWHATPQGGGGPNQGWCLTPPGGSVGRSPDECPVYVEEIAAGGGNQPAILVDKQGGAYGDPPQWCGAHATSTTVESGVRTFGGRTAEWRSFSVRCQGAANLDRDIEQYVVPTDRAFLAFAPKEDATTAAGLTFVAQQSQLPKQDRPLRLQDYGVLTSVTKRGNGYEITVNRIIEATGKPEHATADYLVPSSALQNGPPVVGNKNYVFTNGTTVIQFY